jgi:uncharacterized protein (DUF58 family)
MNGEPSQLGAQGLTQVRVLPSKRLLVLMGLAVLPLLFVPLAFEVVYGVAGVDLALVAGMLFDFAILRRGLRLRVTRKSDPRLSVGADNPITLAIENLGREPATLWVRDGYPGEFEAAGDDIGTNDEVTRGEKLRPRLAAIGQPRKAADIDRDVLAEEEQDRGARGLRRRLARELTPGGDTGQGLKVGAGKRVDVTYMLTPLRRGDYAFGDIAIRAESRLRLATLSAVQTASEPIRVYPNVRNVNQLGVATRFRELKRLGLKQVRREGGGGEFAKLRDYVEGDSYRDINWKATARRRKPVTQVYESERSQNVIICIDAGRLMAARMGQLSKLDYAINAALLLAYTALAGGDRVGLIVFADEVRSFVPPGKGRGHYRLILHTLYGIEPELCHVDYKAMITHLLGRIRRRSLVALFTDLHDETHSRPLVDYTKFLLPRHLPLCITLSDKNLGAMRSQWPSDENELFDRAVATELLRERELLKNELTRLGAQVLDRPADRIAVDTINRYVELKRRQAL